MTARKSSLVNRKYKTKYRVANWPEYERGLRDRGDLTIWISEEAIEAWTPRKTGVPRQPDRGVRAVPEARSLRRLLA